MLSPPPKSTDGSNAEHVLRWTFHTHFEPFFNVIRPHYESRFAWFLDRIPQPSKVIDIGIGKAGAEVFALMWAMASDVALGIDIDIAQASQSNRMRQAAIDLSREVLPLTLDVSPPDFKARLQAWYEVSVCTEVRDERLPLFACADITGGLPCPSGFFDLVYSRYLLDKVEENLRKMAFGEMVRVVGTGGHIITVAPYGTNCLDQIPHQVTLLHSVANDELGKLESMQDKLVGHIFRKDSKSVCAC